MDTQQTIVALKSYISAHHLQGVLAWCILTGIINVFIRKRSTAEWVAYVERHRVGAAFLQIVRGAGFDPKRVLDGFVLLWQGASAAMLQYLTGQPSEQPPGASAKKEDKP